MKNCATFPSPFGFAYIFQDLEVVVAKMVRGIVGIVGESVSTAVIYITKYFSVVRAAMDGSLISAFEPPEGNEFCKKINFCSKHPTPDILLWSR